MLRRKELEGSAVNERSFIFLFDNERPFILHRSFPENYEKLKDTFRRVVGSRGGFGVRRRLPDNRAGRRQYGQRNGRGHRQRQLRRLRRVLESVGGLRNAPRSGQDARGFRRVPRPSDPLRKRQGLDAVRPHGAEQRGFLRNERGCPELLRRPQVYGGSLRHAVCHGPIRP